MWKCPNWAGRVAFFDTLAAMLAALVIIPAMATTEQSWIRVDRDFCLSICQIWSSPCKVLEADHHIIFFVAVLFGWSDIMINLYMKHRLQRFRRSCMLEEKQPVWLSERLAWVFLLIQEMCQLVDGCAFYHHLPAGAGTMRRLCFWVCVGVHWAQVNKGRTKPFTNFIIRFANIWRMAAVCFIVLWFFELR